VGAGAVVGLLVPACTGDGDGGDSTSPAREEYVAALVSTAEDPEFSDEENRCLAEALVDTLGVDRLRAAASPEEIRGNDDFEFTDLGIEMSDADDAGFYDRLEGCLDVRELVVSSLTAGAGPEVAGCVDDHLDDGELRAFVVAALTGSESARTEVMERVMSDLYMDCAAALPGGG
jgi:hypothetical protein